MSVYTSSRDPPPKFKHGFKEKLFYIGTVYEFYQFKVYNVDVRYGNKLYRVIMKNFVPFLDAKLCGILAHSHFSIKEFYLSITQQKIVIPHTNGRKTSSHFF